MTVAPLSSRYVIVGSDARIRVSSVIAPFLIGTLKSTRTKARRPLTSRSSSLREAKAYSPFFWRNASRSTQRLE